MRRLLTVVDQILRRDLEPPRIVLIPRLCEPAGARSKSVSFGILVRLDRLELGLAGDVKPVGAGISELRLPYGPGYRVYFMRTGEDQILLLTGGTKSSQRKDIRRAATMVRTLKREGR